MILYFQSGKKRIAIDTEAKTYAIGYYCSSEMCPGFIKINGTKFFEIATDAEYEYRKVNSI